MKKVAIIGLSGESIFLKVDKMPTPSVTTHAKNLHIEPGGKGYNQAVAAKKLGMNVSYLTKVGRDEYGFYCKKYMDNLGINTFFVEDEKEKTAVATIITDLVGENEVIVYLGASNNLNKSDLELFKKEIKTSDYLLLQYEVSLEIIKEAIKIARENNVKVILNPAPAKYLDKDILESADFVTPNFEEAKALYNVPSSVLTIDELGEFLKNKVTNNLIITLGKNGALLVNKNVIKHFEPYTVDSVDTTGAGDIFNASFIVGLSLYNDLYEAIKFAIISSALSVTKPFVMDAIFEKSEIVELLKLYNLKQK